MSMGSTRRALAAASLFVFAGSGCAWLMGCADTRGGAGGTEGGSNPSGAGGAGGAGSTGAGNERCAGTPTCTGAHRWSKRVGDTADQQGFGIAVDGAGDVLVTGAFRGTIDFGQGPLTSEGDADVFVAKLDAAGKALWSKRFGEASNQVGFGIAADGAGNVLLSGYFQGSIDFGNGPLVTAGDYDMFVAKFDAAGKALWSKRFGDANQHDVVSSMAVDGAGNVLLAGAFKGSADFGNGPLVSAGEEDIFVAKFDAAGKALWSKRFGDAKQQQILGAAVDGAGNVLVTGIFDGTVDFGNEPLVSAGGIDIFVAKFDAAGNALWSRRFGDAGIYQGGTSIAADAAGNVIVTGIFDGTVDFGRGALVSAGGQDLFAAKFDAAGATLWSRRFGDATRIYETVPVSAVDGAGNVLLSGSFEGTIDFGNGPLVSAGGEDVFVAKLDPAGNALWSKGSGSASTQRGSRMAVDGAGNVLVTGEFQATLDLGGGPLTSAGSKDLFLVKLAP
jgi:hypothetical protein